MAEEQVGAENVHSEADRRTDKNTGEQPDGQVETFWWSRPVLPNDRVSQTENTGGGGGRKTSLQWSLSLCFPSPLLSFF